MFRWICPLCSIDVGSFERNSEEALEIVTAAHIIRHEEAASLRAVDAARLECTQAECSLGCRKGYNKNMEAMCPKLTEYDKKFLTGVKISLN